MLVSTHHLADILDLRVLSLSKDELGEG